MKCEICGKEITYVEDVKNAEKGTTHLMAFHGPVDLTGAEFTPAAKIIQEGEKYSAVYFNRRRQILEGQVHTMTEMQAAKDAKKAAKPKKVKTPKTVQDDTQANASPDTVLVEPPASGFASHGIPQDAIKTDIGEGVEHVLQSGSTRVTVKEHAYMDNGKKVYKFAGPDGLMYNTVTEIMQKEVGPTAIWNMVG